MKTGNKGNNNKIKMIIPSFDLFHGQVLLLDILFPKNFGTPYQEHVAFFLAHVHCLAAPETGL